MEQLKYCNKCNVPSTEKPLLTISVEGKEDKYECQSCLIKYFKGKVEERYDVVKQRQNIVCIDDVNETP